MTVDQQFTVLNEKLQLLLKQYARLQKENERLRQELQDSREKEASFVSNRDMLQQQVSVLKLSAGEMNEADKKEFEKKLNLYIREIDKCIAYLSQ